MIITDEYLSQLESRRATKMNEGRGARAKRCMMQEHSDVNVTRRGLVAL